MSGSGLVTSQIHSVAVLQPICLFKMDVFEIDAFATQKV